MRVELSDELATALRPPVLLRQVIYWDTDTTGLGLVVGKRKKTLVFEQRVSGRKRRCKLGEFPDLSIEEARLLAARPTAERIPRWWKPPRLPTTKPSGCVGWVYAVALTPDLTYCRLKLGWTTNMGRRLTSFRTTNPDALLVGLWESDRAFESQLFQLFAQNGAQRIGGSEVFFCKDPWRLVGLIPRWLAGRE